MSYSEKLLGLPIGNVLRRGSIPRDGDGDGMFTGPDGEDNIPLPAAIRLIVEAVRGRPAKFVPPDERDRVISLLKEAKTGGFTRDRYTGEDIKQGIAVGRNYHGLTPIPVEEMFDENGEPTEEAIAMVLGFIEYHGDKVFKNPPDEVRETVLGGWVDNGLFYLDVTDVYESTPRNLARAAELGMKQNQKAVTILENLWKAKESGLDEDWAKAFVDSGGAGSDTIDNAVFKEIAKGYKDVPNIFRRALDKAREIAKARSAAKRTESPAPKNEPTSFSDLKTVEERIARIRELIPELMNLETENGLQDFSDLTVESLMDAGMSRSDAMKLLKAKTIKLSMFEDPAYATGHCGYASATIAERLREMGIPAMVREVGAPGGYGTHFAVQIGDLQDPYDPNALILDFTLRQFYPDDEFPWLSSVEDYAEDGLMKRLPTGLWAFWVFEDDLRKNVDFSKFPLEGKVAPATTYSSRMLGRAKKPMNSALTKENYLRRLKKVLLLMKKKKDKKSLYHQLVETKHIRIVVRD